MSQAQRRADHRHAVLITAAIVLAMGLIVWSGYDLRQMAESYTDAATDSAQSVSQEFKRSLRQIQETSEPQK